MDRVSTICGRSLERSRAGGYYGDMTLLTTPWIASAVARIMQAVVRVLEPRRTRGRRALLPEFPGQTAPLTIPISVGPASVIEVATLRDDDIRATNTAESPARVAPVAGAAAIDGDQLTTTLPAVSWTAIRLAVAGSA